MGCRTWGALLEWRNSEQEFFLHTGGIAHSAIDQGGKKTARCHRGFPSRR
jgi:hypothetical protein